MSTTSWDSSRAGSRRYGAHRLRPGTTIAPLQAGYHLAATDFVTTPVTGAAGSGPDGTPNATTSHFIAASQSTE
ncbi:hypothetical protein [Streptomyces sp. NPDC088766]|uniref:hypothetical protein n=1 Tax=Streptomyces sp. NPDC088766 TaxID=3365893 RepID=UPI00382CA374